ncbi:MAG: Endoglucanase E precursor [Firmicutes bacterium ADurb.Bin419]|nr:MAG: Endoglucanase E precursor [Firmicutes bacterium ADurb.Bin419]
MYKLKFKLQKVLISSLIISTIIGSTFITSSAETKPIKIMPVGDSCTEGMGDPDMGSYRTELYNLYKNTGLNFDFVGSNQRGPSSLPDKDNEGHSGWTIPEVANNINGWLNTQDPDVVFLWIGGNDIFRTGKINPTGLSNLIDQILTVKPNVTIFVSDYYPWPDIVLEYNAVIPGVVEQKAKEGKKVYFVKLSDVDFTPGADLSNDGLHLNTQAYKKIAKIWYDNTINILKGSNSNIIKGDIDGNGAVNSIDFGYFRQYLLGINTFPSPNGKESADINNDGLINSIDYANLKLILLGLPTIG